MDIVVESKKGQPCPYKPITCQEGYCQDCEIYLKQLEAQPPKLKVFGERKTVMSKMALQAKQHEG